MLYWYQINKTGRQTEVAFSLNELVDLPTKYQLKKTEVLQTEMQYSRKGANL